MKNKAKVGGGAGAGVLVAIGVLLHSLAGAGKLALRDFAAELHVAPGIVREEAVSMRTYWLDARNSLRELGDNLEAFGQSDAGQLAESTLCSLLETTAASGTLPDEEDMSKALWDAGLKRIGLTAPQQHLRDIASQASQAAANGNLGYYGFVAGFCELPE